MKKKLLHIILSGLSILCAFQKAVAQISNVNVTIVASPPYSPYLTDYLIYENRAAVIVTATGTPGSTAKIYFKGHITGDNGVNIKTKSNYYPSTNLTLTANVPKRLTGLEIKDFFDWSYVEVTGVSMTQVVRNNGLPEGNYQICLQAYDYDTRQPLGIESCSNNISIQHVDPPLPTSPVCGTDIEATTPQHVMFSWTYNPGVDRNVRYLLKIVELIGNQNPNDAINSQTTPAFFEKTLSSINYLYTATDPALKTGKKYAWRVKAYDLNDKIKFKNNGESEVCTFEYKTAPVFETIKSGLGVKSDAVPLKSPPISPESDEGQKLVIINPADGGILNYSNTENFLVNWFTGDQYNYFYQPKLSNGKQLFDKNKKLEEDTKMLHMADGWHFSLKFVTQADYNKNGQKFESCTPVWSLDTITREHFELGVNGGNLIKLKDGEMYAVKVYGADVMQKKHESAVHLFKFVNKWKKPVVEIGDLTCKLKVYYHFQGVADELPMYSTPYGIYDVWYIEDANGLKYRLPSNKFNSPVGEITSGTITDATAYFTIKKSMLDTTSGYGQIKPTYTAPVLIGNVYKNITGKLFHSLYLLPYSPYYIYTDNYIFPVFSKDVSKSESYNGGKALYTLYDYDATIRLHKKYFVDGKEIVDDNSKYLLNKMVYVLRKSYPALTPTGDGDGSGNHENKTIGGVNYWVIDKHMSVAAKDSKGNDIVQVEMKNLICNWLPDDEYWLYVEGEPLSCLTKGKFAPAAPVNIFQFHYHREFDYYLVSPNPPNSTVTGRLLYKYADGGETETYPLAYKNIKIVSYYQVTQNGPNTPNTVLHNKSDMFNLFYGVGQDALAKAQIGNDYDNPTTVVATGTTDENGNFKIDIPYNFLVGKNFDFSGKNGEFGWDQVKMKHVLRVVVDNQYFCSPDDNIALTPFQTTNVGSLTALVKSYELKVYVNSSSKDYNTTSSNSGMLNGVKVKVIRYNPDLIYDNYYAPKTEGLQYSDPSPDATLGKTISSDYTNDKGIVSFKRMVRHVSWSPYDYYYIKSETDNSSGYNYEPAVVDDTKKDFGGLTAKLGDKNANDIYPDLFNSEYKYTVYRSVIQMKPKLPKISGRLVNANSGNKGLPGGDVWFLKTYTGAFTPLNDVEYSTTDENGYFFTENIIPIYSPGSSPVNQPQVLTMVMKNGYWNKDDGKTYFSKTEPGVKLGQLINYKDIPFGSNAAVFVKVEDEEGKSVEAFARVGNDIDDKYCNTLMYSLYAPSGKNQTLYILPLDPKYYPDTITIAEVKPGWNMMPDKVIVKIRKHRISFKVTDADTKKEIMGATVTFVELSNQPKATTDQFGRTPNIEFLNIATHQFNVKIETWGYSTLYKSITDYEVKNGNHVYEVQLKKGKYAWGHIKLDGAPMKNAMVYVKAGSGMPLISTQTDNDGLYFLTGLPDIGTQIVINANAVSGTSLKTVMGQSKTIKLIGGKDDYQLDFDLKTIDSVDLTQLLGFPIMLEKYASKPGSKALISGVISFDKNNTTYKPMLGNDNITFSDVEVESKSYYNAKMKKTFYVSVPTVDSIDLSVKEWKIKANNEFNILLYNIDKKKIRLFKSQQTNGELNALARIVDNSFNVPSSYLHFNDDQFYLYAGSAIDKNIRPTFFTNTSIKNVDYHLAVSDNKYGPIQFQYLGFDARSGDDAYLEDDKIIIPAVLSTTYPEGGTLDNIKAGKLVLHSTYFEPVKGNEPLTFNFEKWTVVVKDWLLDNSKGGFSSGDATFKTGLVDVKCNQFLLKANHLPYFDGFDMENLTLGGLLPLNVNNSATKHIGYDLQTGTDNKPHWKLSLIGNTTPAATVKNIPGTADELSFLAISLISNGEAIVTMKNNTTLKYNCGVSFKPSTFSMPINSQGVANSFALQGTLSTGIPRTADNVNATLIFSGQPNNLKMKLAPLNFNFEGKGFVQFKSSPDNQLLNNNEFSIEGTIEEPGKLSPIKVKLHRTKDLISITENNPDPIYFGEKKMSNVKCNMVVNKSTTDWDLLTFNGYMDSFEGIGKKDEDRHFTFTVYGEIKAEGQQLKMDGINTPFGNMQLTFDLAKARITGLLDLDGIDFGGTALNGQANILLDKGGFYIAASVQVSTPAVGTFSGGALIGKYKEYSVLTNSGAVTTLLANAYDKNVPCTFQQDGLTGFMVVGKRELKPIPDFNLDLVVLDVSLVAGAGVDARVYMNLAGGFTFGVGVLAFAHVDLVCSSITCTEIDGHAEAQAKITAQYTPGNFSMEGCGSAYVGIHGQQCIPTIIYGCISPCLDLGKDFGIAYKVSASQQSGLTQQILWGKQCNETQDCPPK